MTSLPAARKLRCIREVMVAAPYSVQDGHSLAIAEKLMRDKRIRHLPVFHLKKLLGVLSERELENAIRRDASATVASAAISPLVIAAPEDQLSDVARRLAQSRADLACVVDRTRLVGVFTTIDALKVLADLLDAELAPPALP